MNAAQSAGQSHASAADDLTPPDGLPAARPLGRSRQRRQKLLDELRVALTTRGGRRRRTEATLDTYLAFIEARPQVYRFLMHKASVEEPEVHGQMTSFVRRVAEELGAGIQF